MTENIPNLLKNETILKNLNKKYTELDEKTKKYENKLNEMGSSMKLTSKGSIDSSSQNSA